MVKPDLYGVENEELILVILPQASEEYGPISHYYLIVVPDDKSNNNKYPDAFLTDEVREIYPLSTPSLQLFFFCRCWLARAKNRSEKTRHTLLPGFPNETFHTHTHLALEKLMMVLQTANSIATKNTACLSGLLSTLHKR
jgi:hypothetical protein